MSRRHDLDTLRVLAFALLILYHVGMVYVVEWGFHIKSPSTLPWVEWPMVLVNRWRMSLLFLLSGLTLGPVMTRRSTPRLVAERSWRLLLPLVFGIVVIVPVQAWCEARMRGTFDAGFGTFLLRYLQFQPWAPDTFTGAEYGFTWNHLWYLPYLWVYTLLALALVPVLRTCGGTRMGDWLYTRGRWLLWTAPPACYLFALWVLDPRFPSTHALAGDWFNHARYGVVFTFGLLIARSDAIWTTLATCRRILLVCVLASGTCYLGLRAAGAWLPGDAYLSLLPLEAWRGVMRVIQTIYWWTALLALLAWGGASAGSPLAWPALRH